jgi:maltose O-acetyltransferase
MRERMLAGQLYIADDPELAQQSARARALTHQLNMSDPTDTARHREILTELLAAFGQGSEVRPPLYCDYGYHASIGARCFAN